MNGIFGNNKPSVPAGWKVLDREAQVEELIRKSFEIPVVIFKHSTRCGTSAMAKYGLETRWGFCGIRAGFFLSRFAALPVSI